MKLRFTPRATADLIAIADYVRERNPEAALRVRAAILDSLQNLVLFPEAGRRQTVEGVRKFVTRKYPYLIYYTVDDAADEIVLLTIRHPAQERQHEDVWQGNRQSSASGPWFPPHRRLAERAGRFPHARMRVSDSTDSRRPTVLSTASRVLSVGLPLGESAR